MEVNGGPDVAGAAGWRGEVAMALDGVHPRFGRAFVLPLYALILASVLAIGLETVPDLPGWAVGGLEAFEIFTVCVFSLEYGLRLATAPKPLAYAVSFFGMVDLISVLPFYLSLGIDLRAFRAVRLVRLLRLFKLARYSRAIDRFTEAGRMIREELVVFLAIEVAILYLCAIGIYYFEHDAQPAAYGSVFQSMWWAAVTLTTVGYGDVYPITTGGRIFTVVVLLVGVAAIAVPTGIVTSAFSKLRAKRDDE